MGDDAAPTPPSPEQSSRPTSRRWFVRALAAAAFGLAGLLAVTSTLTAGGTDLRSARQADLAELVREQVLQKEALERQAAKLRTQIDQLSREIAGEDGDQAQRKAAELGTDVGLTPVRGPGMTVVLDDAPPEMREKTEGIDGGDNALVVHQQDIQAVANALWAGGAEAMTIQGQRVISTSAIRCVGNSVVLHGVPYPPPYEVSAIGDVAGMTRELNEAPGVQRYLVDVDRYQLGYDVSTADRLELPGFDGSLDLKYAEQG